MIRGLRLLIMALFLLTLMNCTRNDNFKVEGEKLIDSNIEFLLDSIKSFDWTKIPLNKKSIHDKRETFRYELIDVVLVEQNSMRFLNSNFNAKLAHSKAISLKINPSFISKFKLKHVALVKKKSNSIYALSIVFSNLLMSDNERYASIVVTKTCGISMKKDVFYFEKRNGKWVYLRKDQLSMG